MTFRVVILGAVLALPAATVFERPASAAADQRQDFMLLRAPATTNAGLALRDRSTDRRPDVGPGVVVTGVLDGSPSDLAGISARDVIEAIDEVEVKGAKQLLATLAETLPGKAVSVKIRRGRAQLTVSLIPQPLVR